MIYWYAETPYIKALAVIPPHGMDVNSLMEKTDQVLKMLMAERGLKDQCNS